MLWARRLRFCMAYLRGRHACVLHDREMRKKHNIYSWPHYVEENAMNKAARDLRIPHEYDRPTQLVGFLRGWHMRTNPKHIHEPEFRWRRSSWDDRWHPASHTSPWWWRFRL